MTSHDVDATRLLDLDAAKWQLVHVNARRAQEGTLRGVDVDAALVAGDAVEVACEVFRRAHYPSRGRVFVGLGAVHTSGRSGRGARVVFERLVDATHRVESASDGRGSYRWECSCGALGPKMRSFSATDAAALAHVVAARS